MNRNDSLPEETGKPSTDPTPAGDVPTLRELADDEGGFVPLDKPDTANATKE